jgi:hypothetical protein
MVLVGPAWTSAVAVPHEYWMCREACAYRDGPSVTLTPQRYKPCAAGASTLTVCEAAAAYWLYQKCLRQLQHIGCTVVEAWQCCQFCAVYPYSARQHTEVTLCNATATTPTCPAGSCARRPDHCGQCATPVRLVLNMCACGNCMSRSSLTLLCTSNLLVVPLLIMHRSTVQPFRRSTAQLFNRP